MKKLMILVIFSFCLGCNHKQDKKDLFSKNNVEKNNIKLDSTKYLIINHNILDIKGTFISKNSRYLLNICTYMRFEDKKIANFFKEYLNTQTTNLSYEDIQYAYFLKKYIDSIGIKRNDISDNKIKEMYHENRNYYQKISSTFITYYEIIDLVSNHKHKLIGKFYDNNNYDNDTIICKSDTVNQFYFTYLHDYGINRMREYGEPLYRIDRQVKSYLDSTGFYGQYFSISKKGYKTLPYRLILDEEVERNKIINKSFFHK